jgi:hypothetical protein
MPESTNKIAVVKVNNELGLVFGYAIVSSINGEDYYDLQGDHISDSEILKAATTYMSGDRAVKEMHREDTDGKVIFAMPLTKDIAEALEIQTPIHGLLIGMKPSKEVFAKFKNGEYKGFSIGGMSAVMEDTETDNQEGESDEKK